MQISEARERRMVEEKRERERVEEHRGIQYESKSRVEVYIYGRSRRISGCKSTGYA